MLHKKCTREIQRLGITIADLEKSLRTCESQLSAESARLAEAKNEISNLVKKLETDLTQMTDLQRENGALGEILTAIAGQTKLHNSEILELLSVREELVKVTQLPSINIIINIVLPRAPHRLADVVRHVAHLPISLKKINKLLIAPKISTNPAEDRRVVISIAAKHRGKFEEVCAVLYDYFLEALHLDSGRIKMNVDNRTVIYIYHEIANGYV